MFFENDNFNIEITTVLHIKRGKSNASSSKRLHYALSLRVKGDAVFTEAGKSLRANDGDVAFVPPSSNYRLISESEELYVIHFLCESKLAERIKLLTPRDTGAMLRLFGEIHTAYLEKKPGYKHRCRYLFYKLVYAIEQETASNELAAKNKYLSLALGYISEHLCEQTFCAEAVSSALNISSVYLRKLFKADLGCSVKEYIDKARTERALELLGSGYYTVGEVSEMCGFSDTYYFSAFIKKHTGSSPKHHLG